MAWRYSRLGQPHCKLCMFNFVGFWTPLRFPVETQTLCHTVLALGLLFGAAFWRIFRRNPSRNVLPLELCFSITAMLAKVDQSQLGKPDSHYTRGKKKILRSKLRNQLGGQKMREEDQPGLVLAVWQGSWAGEPVAVGRRFPVWYLDVCEHHHHPEIRWDGSFCSGHSLQTTFKPCMWQRCLKPGHGCGLET